MLTWLGIMMIRKAKIKWNETGYTNLNEYTFNVSQNDIYYPGKLKVRALFQDDPEVLYVARLYCDALVTMDDDSAIGSCKCSNCKKSIDVFDKFCRHCGAKSRGRKIVQEDTDISKEKGEKDGSSETSNT